MSRVVALSAIVSSALAVAPAHADPARDALERLALIDRQLERVHQRGELDRSYGKSFFEGAVGIDVDLARNRIYVADSNRNLMILRIDG